MAQTHTPGPWKVEHDGAGYPMIASSEASDAVTEARYVWIANVYAMPDMAYKAGKARETGKVLETEANARLIAAAPAMLEALRDILSAMDDEIRLWDDAGHEFPNADRIVPILDAADQLVASIEASGDA